MKPDPRSVLEALAESLDAGAVIDLFPGLDRKGLTDIIMAAASKASPSRKEKEGLVAFIDGAARGNPGEAGAGVVLKDRGGTDVEKIALYLGRATNNMAEYKALLLALQRARELGVKSLQVYSDSELLVHKFNGSYRVRAALLLELCH